MEAVLMLIGAVGLLALFDLGGLALGTDSRDGIGDDHQRSSREVI